MGLVDWVEGEFESGEKIESNIGRRGDWDIDVRNLEFRISLRKVRGF